MDKPIPAFYACYLLRSTIRHASLYVGSTPNPVRRLRQHNGESKGGAVKTSKDSLRPWEMTCLVTGFPSKIAALQFEWAWQHTHLTRHVSPNSRLARANPGGTRLSPKSGRLRKRPAKPRLCLTDRLANLHLLLRSSSFERWPLQVTFYAADVFKIWQRWLKQDPARDGGIRKGIEVALREESAVEGGAEGVPSGIHALDVGYGALKSQLEVSKAILESMEPCRCAVCDADLPESGAGMLVCSHPGCTSTTHLTCLAGHFLTNGTEKAALLPTQGTCPACRGELHWVDMVKELSLRMRGEKEIDALYKVPRARKKKIVAGKAMVLPEEDDDEASEGDELPDEPILHENDDGRDAWFQLPDTSDVEEQDGSVMRSDPSPLHRRKADDVYAGASRSEPAVEDSDWDDADVLL
ncbi:Slx4p interacting protein [Oleoguttula sp. CCFEE 5521]